MRSGLLVLCGVLAGSAAAAASASGRTLAVLSADALAGFEQEFPDQKGSHPITGGWHVGAHPADAMGRLRFETVEEVNALRLENDSGAHGVSVSLDQGTNHAALWLRPLRRHIVTVRYKVVGSPGAFLALHPNHVVGALLPEPDTRDDALRYNLLSDVWATLRVEFATGRPGPMRMVLSTSNPKEGALLIAECQLEEGGPYLDPRRFAKTTPPFSTVPLVWLDQAHHDNFEFASTEPQGVYRPGGLPFGWLFTQHIADASGRLVSTNVLGAGALALLNDQPRAGPTFVCLGLPNYRAIQVGPGWTLLFTGIYATTPQSKGGARFKLESGRRLPEINVELAPSPAQWSGFFIEARLAEQANATLGLSLAASREPGALFLRSAQLSGIAHRTDGQ